jgi:hypothetical protein
MARYQFHPTTLSLLCHLVRKGIPPLARTDSTDKAVPNSPASKDGEVPDIARNPGAMVQTTANVVTLLRALQIHDCLEDVVLMYQLFRDSYLPELAYFAQIQGIDPTPLHRMVAMPTPEAICEAEAVVERLQQIGVLAPAEAKAVEAKPNSSGAPPAGMGPEARMDERAPFVPPLMTAANLATFLVEPINPVEIFLRRYRKRHIDCYIPNEGRRKGDSFYIYRTPEVLPALLEWQKRRHRHDGKMTDDY